MAGQWQARADGMQLGPPDTAANDEACRALLRHRERQETPADERNIPFRGKIRRPKISKAKQPMLDAIQKIVFDHQKYWSLSARRVHYSLTKGSPPLRHQSKPNSQYRNDHDSYKDVCDLLTCGKLAMRNRP